MVVIDVIVFVVAVLWTAYILSAAVRTVVVPRAESILLNRVVFIGMRAVFAFVANRRSNYLAKDRILARYAPITLFVLVGAWAVGVGLGFAGMLWALDVRPVSEAVVQSGSSLTTLGFRTTGRTEVQVLEIIEALIGLGLVALMISFLPTMYGAFSRREAGVARLSIRAGTPPSPTELITRAHRIGWLERLEQTWADWEIWFVDVEESHTTYPALAWFRSPDPNRSWVVAAGSALDTASIMLSAVDVPRSPQAALCIRSGYTALRRIADFFRIPYDPDPLPTDPISVARDEFDQVIDQLASAGVPVKSDRDQMWRDFQGWRVNYDPVLIGLCQLTSPPPAPWSSDRSPSYRHPPIWRRVW